MLEDLVGFFQPAGFAQKAGQVIVVFGIAGFDFNGLFQKQQRLGKFVLLVVIKAML